MTTPSAVPPPPSELAVRTCGVAGITGAVPRRRLARLGHAAGQRQGRAATQAADLDAALHGEVTHQLAKQLSGSFLARRAANIERGASWLLFHDTGPRVRRCRAGCS